MDINNFLALPTFVFAWILLGPTNTIAQNSFRNIASLTPGAHVYFDHSHLNRVFAIGPDDSLTILTSSGDREDHILRAVDRSCLEENGLNEFVVLAYPYFANLNRVCLIDLETRTIRNLESIAYTVNSFSVMYLGRAGSSSYFVINGRSFAHADGYLKLVTVDADTREVHTRELVTHVPGFSGAMWNSSTFYLTVWNVENYMYTLNKTLLLQMIAHPTTVHFNEVATRILGPFNGLSLRMMATVDDFIYLNGEYENYQIHRHSSSLRDVEISQDCQIVGVFDEEWLLYCSPGMLMQGHF